LCARVLRLVCARTRAQLRGNIDPDPNLPSPFMKDDVCLNGSCIGDKMSCLYLYMLDSSQLSLPTFCITDQKGGNVRRNVLGGVGKCLKGKCPEVNILRDIQISYFEAFLRHFMEICLKCHHYRSLLLS